MQTAHKRKQYSLWNMSNVKTQNALSTEVVWQRLKTESVVVRLIPFLYLLNTDFNGSFSSPTGKFINCLHISYTLM